MGRVIGGQMHEQKHSINSSRRDDSTYRRRYREELFEAPYVVIYVSVICIYHLFLRFLFFIFSLFERGIFSLLHFLRKLRPGRGFFFSNLLIGFGRLIFFDSTYFFGETIAHTFY